jgi:formiminotetrahydrofolate cyclodeaminase
VAGSDYLDLRLGDFLESLSAPGPVPGGGAAAALTVSFAAGLVTMAARRSADSWPEARGVAAQARTLLARTAPLAQSDADAWHAALDALEEPPGEDELEERLTRAAQVPLAIADTAADVAELAALVAEMGDGTYRGDAAAAALLAEAGARAAEKLVAVNLTVTPEDPRLVRARRAAEAAHAAVARALDSGP